MSATCSERKGTTLVSVVRREIGAKELGELRQEFALAALAGDRPHCLNQARHLLEITGSLMTPYLELFQPVLRSLESRFGAGEVTTKQVGTVGAVVQSLMSELSASVHLGPFNSSRASGSSGLTVVMVPFAGDAHHVGVRMVSDLLQLAGFTVHRVTAVEEALEGALLEIERLRPQAVGISVGTDSGLTHARELVGRSRTLALEPRPKIMVGGAAFRNNPHAWREIEADLFADDAAAVVSCLSSTLT